MSERPFSSFGPDEWDNFVLASEGSFLGSWRVVNARRLLGPVRIFEFFADDESPSPTKVGQCAITAVRGKVTFLDRIHLRPGQRHLWERCFKLVVRRFGAATYLYGSSWNNEARIELGATQGFVAEPGPNAQFHIDLIDFRDWVTFPAYRRAVSENIRRDWKKAKQTSAVVETRCGLAALRDLRVLVALRTEVMRKNRQPSSPLVDYVRHAAKLAILGRNGFITMVRMSGRCYSVFFGTRFGSNLYYISGGTTNNGHGLGSYLLLTLIENWFATHSTGKFFVGFAVGAATEARDLSGYNSGALLYRRKLRVSSVSGVEFQLTVRPDNQWGSRLG